jgi:hypothetical protein
MWWELQFKVFFIQKYIKIIFKFFFFDIRYKKILILNKNKKKFQNGWNGHLFTYLGSIYVISLG